MPDGAFLGPGCHTCPETLSHPSVHLILESRTEYGLYSASHRFLDHVKRCRGMLGSLVQKEAWHGSESESFQKDKRQETVLLVS